MSEPSKIRAHCAIGPKNQFSKWQPSLAENLVTDFDMSNLSSDFRLCVQGTGRSLRGAAELFEVRYEIESPAFCIRSVLHVKKLSDRLIHDFF
jgi:hypothetical protein